VLTHVSSRHNWRELRDEARAIFADAFLPWDFDQLMVPYPEKGLPVLAPRGSCGPAT